MADRRRRGARPGGAGGVAVLALVCAIAGCSSGGEAAPSPSASTSEASSPATREARIGVIASHRGDLAPVGKGVRDAVELAVREANAIAAVPGWSFDAVQGDDTSTQSGGQQVASGLAADSRVIGVVGTTRSVIDEGAQPILNNAGIAMVSPGGTAPTLTKRVSGTSVVRPFPTYFRLAPTDGDEGVAAARHVATGLGVRRVAVLSDGSSYGRLLAAAFEAEAARLGLARPVVRTLTLPPSLPEATAAARRERAAAAVRRARVGAVFFGGSAPAAADFTDALRSLKVRAPLIGGDALLDGRYVRSLDSASPTAPGSPSASASASDSPAATPGPGEGDMAVFPGAPASDLDTARGFVRRYRAAGFGADPGPYAAAAYDAAWAIIRAFGEAAGDTTEIDRDVRDAVVAELGALRFEGATGPVSFDRFGDARQRPLTVYTLVSGRWEVAEIVRVGSGVGGRS